MAIRSYRDKDTEALAAGERVRAFEECKRAAEKALTKLQAATRLIDLCSPPSNRFEAMRGDRQGQYSIRIDGKWRVCFKWAPHEPAPAGLDDLTVRGEPYDVDITDYH